jgi:hypothetical protein
MAGTAISEAKVNQFLSENTQLAEGQWKKFCDGIQDPWLKGCVARLLENTKSFFMNLDETTRTVQIGDFEKYAFPLVRAIFPELIASRLVSVQPMQGPVSLVFYLDFVYGTTKGNITKGNKMFDSIGLGPNTQNYTSEVVEGETVSTTDFAANAQITGTLAFTPIRPGTVQITDGTLLITDDGNGVLTGDTGSGGAKTVNYMTGALDFSFGTDPAAPILATYEYDMEANTNIPEVDLVLVQSPVTARPRKLRTRWSLESAFNLRALHGLEAETELTAAVGSEIRFEIDREIIQTLVSVAFAGADFNVSSVGQESYSERKLALVDTFVSHNNKIFKQTGRGTGSWIVCGVNVANIIEALPGFVRVPVPVGVKGPHLCGRLNGQWEVYKDPFMPATASGALGDNGYLVGYRGTSFLEAGLVYAPYIPLYTTPTIVLDDFIGRKGLATQYGKKLVNAKFYTKGRITNPVFQS